MTLRPAHQFRLLALVFFVILWHVLPSAFTALWALAKVLLLLFVSLAVAAYVLSYIHEKFFEDG